MTTNNDGPYLSVAAICEQILEEKDGFVSAIRFIDKITLTPALLNMPPEQLREASITINTLIVFKSGSYKGKKTVKLLMVYPSGKQLPSDMSFPVAFKGEETGATLFIKIVFPPEEDGLYQLDILLDEDFVTRIPFRIIYGQTQPRPTGMENSKTQGIPAGS